MSILKGSLVTPLLTVAHAAKKLVQAVGPKNED